jgi:protein MpaA
MEPSRLLSKSAGNKDIFYYSLGDVKKPCFILMGGVHGDEPEGSVVVEKFLIEATKIQEKFKTHTLVIPRYNPDGLEANERMNSNGVDLNRNFPSADWSSEARAPRYYPGTGPSSEPETKGLVALIKNHTPFLIVHCHTYLPQVCYTGVKSMKWAEILSKNFGFPVTENIGYPTPGSLGQYCLLDLDIACVCVELPESVKPKKAWDMIGSSLLEISTNGP